MKSSSPQLRPNDLFGRIGGEEFASLLPNTTRQDAASLAERVRTAVESASLRVYFTSSNFFPPCPTGRVRPCGGSHRSCDRQRGCGRIIERYVSRSCRASQKQPTRLSIAPKRLVGTAWKYRPMSLNAHRLGGATSCQ